MPRARLSTEAINQQKIRIMDEAASLMASDGIGALSMRILANRLGMTAANLYNYFPNKQALFAATSERGFQLLDQYTEAGVAGIENPREKLAALLKSAVRFAGEWTGYWELLLHPPTPLRIRLEAEDSALVSDLRQRTSERMLGLLMELLARSGIELAAPEPGQQLPDMAAMSGQDFGPNAIWVRIITLLTNTHGLIDLYNHRMLDKLGVEVPPLVDALIDASIDIILPPAPWAPSIHADKDIP